MVSVSLWPRPLPTEGGGRLQLAARQVGSGEVTALVVVVLDVERAQFGEVDPQRAAAVVDVLTVQRLRHKQSDWSRARPITRVQTGAGTHGLGVLSVHGLAELQQSLELVVSGEGDDFQH